MSVNREEGELHHVLLQALVFENYNLMLTQLMKVSCAQGMGRRVSGEWERRRGCLCMGVCV